MNSDQKIGVALLLGLAGFAVAVAFGRKPSENVIAEAAPLQLAGDAFATPIEIAEPSTDPFGAPVAMPAAETPPTSPSAAAARRAMPELAPPVREPQPEPVSMPPPAVASDPVEIIDAAAAGESFRTYVVQPGDTLSGIAYREFGTITRYYDLFEANEDQLAHPDDLRVGQTLRIPVDVAVAPDAATR